MNQKRISIFLLSIEVTILFLVILLGITNKAESTVTEFTSDMFSIAQENENGLEVYEGIGTLDEVFVGTNRRIISPEIVLDRGIYQVDVFYDTTTPATSSLGGHTLATSSENSWIESESVLLTDRANHVDYRMYVQKNDVSVTLRTIIDDEVYDSITINKIAVTSLDGRSLAVSVVKLIFLFLILDGVLFLLLYRNHVFAKLSSETALIILGLLTLFFLVELPMTMSYIPKGYDLRFHYYRIYSIASGLQEGMFPVKLQPEWVNGYGYPTGVFYGDILLYFPAILYLIGFPLSFAYKSYVFAINLFTVLSSYYCFKTISHDKKIGFAGAAIYTMSLHRLVATYTRAALGAFSAMAFLPFVILGLWCIYQEKEEKASKGWLYLAIGISGILETHILGTIMTCLFVLLFVLLSFKKTFQLQTLISLGKAVIATILLNLFFIVPFLDLYLGTELRIQTEHRSIEQYSAFLSQLFTSVYNAVGDVREDLIGMYHDMPMTLGPAALVLLLCCIVYVFLYKDKKAVHLLFKPFALLLLALWLSTNLFPYKWLEEYVPALFYLFMKFEFAWRFQAIATALLPLLFILFLSLLKTKLPAQKVLAFGGVITLLFVWQGTSYLFQYSDSMIRFEHEADFRDLTVGAVYNGQYFPDGFEETETIREITVSDPSTVEWNLLEAGKLKYRVSLNNHQNSEAYVEFPVILYKGYHALCEDGELQATYGQNQRLRVIVPANFEGNISLSYSEPWYWRVAEILSLITLLVLTVYQVYRIKRKHS